MDTGIESVKTSSKKVVHKVGEFIGNTIADAVTKSNDDDIEKQESVEETIFHQNKEV